MSHAESSYAKTMDSESVSKGHSSTSAPPSKAKLRNIVFSRISRWSVFGCETSGDALGGEEISSMVMDKIPLKVVTTCTFSEFA